VDFDEAKTWIETLGVECVIKKKDWDAMNEMMRAIYMANCAEEARKPAKIMASMTFEMNHSGAIGKIS